MKKKTIVFLVVVSLLALPVVASAATEFTLGGYIKLQAFWDSAAINKNINAPPRRNNDPEGQHGRFNATSQSSRFNFTIKGPDLWGAKTTGYLEMDFDGAGDLRQSASHAYSPRLRHAFFRLNWPGTELLMGQYWDYFCEFYPESIQDGPFQGHGQATHRLPQIRVTQTFGLGWAKDDKVTLSALIGKPTDSADADKGIGGTPNPYPVTDKTLSGQTSETPQIQGKIQYEGDLWGKGPFYGRPRGFTAQVAGAWQRSRYQFARTATEQKYLNNWAVQGTLFIPVIPTATKNLAGTAALTVQAYVGQGLGFIGNTTGQNSYISRVGVGPTALERELQRTWGGYVQGTYYFSNAWYLVIAGGLGVNYGVNGYDSQVQNANLLHNWWEVDAALYYRPIQAFKFGLGYVYTRGEYYRNTTVQSNTTNFGEAHRVQFGGWFYF